MNYEVITLFNGFPAKSSRGFLGWSSVYLIKIFKENKEILMLFDTGGYGERDELIKKLYQLDIDESDINAVFISHLHFDHAVNWTLFLNADIYINSKELYRNQDYIDKMVPDFHAEKLIKHNKTKIIKNGDKIYGFEVIDLPGHTNGLVGLKHKKTFFVSDAIKNRGEILNSSFTNVLNIEKNKKTVDFIIKEADLIYPGHDVPLIKTESGWESISDSEVSVILTGGLKSTNGDMEFKIKI